MADDKLNNLLEDALEDLLCGTPVESKGKPDIGESLKKITNVTEKKQDSANVIDQEAMNQFFASMTEQLNRGLPEMDPDEAQAKINETVPQLYDLMKNLLSKELLYPTLKELSPKFDEWLNKNSPTLSKEDRKRYKKQISKINEMIKVFDDESMDDKQRFETNLDLMEQMQALGAPPEELTANSPDALNKCSIM